MTDTIGLTEADRRKLADMARQGVTAYTEAQFDDSKAVTCQTCGHEWRTISPYKRVTCSACGYKTPNPNGPDTPDGRGLTPAMCNAIREAAHDGLSTGEITDLFGFVGGRETARRHAYGRCKHDGVPAVASRGPGPHPAVDSAECARLRDRYDRGKTMRELADVFGRSISTVSQHLNGACEHE